MYACIYCTRDAGIGKTLEPHLKYLYCNGKYCYNIDILLEISTI